jgi:hypothetical protein
MLKSSASLTLRDSRSISATRTAPPLAVGEELILGLDVTSSEDGAGWLAFLRGLAASGRHRIGVVQGLQALYPRDGSA